MQVKISRSPKLSRSQINKKFMHKKQPQQVHKAKFSFQKPKNLTFASGPIKKYQILRFTPIFNSNYLRTQALLRLVDR